MNAIYCDACRAVHTCGYRLKSNHALTKKNNRDTIKSRHTCLTIYRGWKKSISPKLSSQRWQARKVPLCQADLQCQCQPDDLAQPNNSHQEYGRSNPWDQGYLPPSCCASTDNFGTGCLSATMFRFPGTRKKWGENWIIPHTMQRPNTAQDSDINFYLFIMFIRKIIITSTKIIIKELNWKFIMNFMKYNKAPETLL